MTRLYPPKADICSALADVRFVPIADILLAEDQTRVCTAVIFVPKITHRKTLTRPKELREKH